MAYPKASILWINYNSMPIIDVVLESLSAINELDYPDFELIIVDNGSTDRSFKIIRAYVKKLSIKTKILRSEINLGFTGGNNLAYNIADKESKYIVLLNNDAIPFPNSLRELIEILESLPNVGAVQGIIFNYNNPSIKNAGFLLDEFMRAVELTFMPKRPLPITYPSGCYSVLNRDILKKIGLRKRLFIDKAFAFLDDNYIGMKLWHNGYKVLTVPVKACYHYLSGTFSRYNLFKIYLSMRAWIARIYLTNIKWKPIYALFALSYFARLAKRFGKLKNAYYKLLLRAVIDGVKLAKEINETYDIYKIPIIRLGRSRISNIIKIPLYITVRRVLDIESTSIINRLEKHNRLGI